MLAAPAMEYCGSPEQRPGARRRADQEGPQELYEVPPATPGARQGRGRRRYSRRTQRDDPERPRPRSCERHLKIESKFFHIGYQLRLLRIILETAHGRDRRTTVQPSNEFSVNSLCEDLFERGALDLRKLVATCRGCEQPAEQLRPPPGAAGIEVSPAPFNPCFFRNASLATSCMAISELLISCSPPETWSAGVRKPSAGQPDLGGGRGELRPGAPCCCRF